MLRSEPALRARNTPRSQEITVVPEQPHPIRLTGPSEAVTNPLCVRSLVTPSRKGDPLSTSQPDMDIRAGVLITLAAVLVGCSAAEDGTIGQGEDTRTAEPLAHALPAPRLMRVDPPALDFEQRRRHSEVEQYLANRYREQGWRIVETTQTYVGDIVDWLDPTSVPGSQIEPPPKPSPEELQPAPGASLGLTELDMYPELRGPQGTIPMLRPSFARYVQEETEASSVDDFIKRYHVPGMPAGQNRLYAGLGKKVANKAATSWANAFGGTIESGTFTLLEMAVLTRGPTPTTTHEQVGIALSRDKVNFGYADSLLRIQVEFLTAGDQVTGNGVGGWDGIRTGFIAAAGRPYPPGTVVAPSTIGGIQYEYHFKIQLSGGNWWVAHNENWLGYYPGSLFNLINASAEEVLWYGEVYDPTPTSWTWTDMGSGLFASTGWTNASNFRNPSYITPSGVSYWADGAGNANPNAGACYTKSNLYSGASPWDRYFYLGGPGGEAPGCD